jgi:hypothetical protein
VTFARSELIRSYSDSKDLSQTPTNAYSEDPPCELNNAPAFGFDPGRAAVFDQHAMDVDPGPDAQVKPVARRSKIADRSRNMDSVAAILRFGPKAG